MNPPAAALSMAAAMMLAACSPDAPPAARSIALQQALGGDGGDGYQQALQPRRFTFPRDHAPHDGFRTEWWHLVGTLAHAGAGGNDAGGGRFGFQASFFRIAPAPPALTMNAADAGDSNWRASHIWMAHAALTDAPGKRHFAEERFAREALELAGATARPLAVWVGDWRLSARGADFPGHVRVAGDEFEFDLALTPQRAPLLQGDGGLSKKGAARGAASYYYSLTRIQAAGEVRLDGRAYQVTGLAWLDREWSSNPLAPGLAGWDWLALHFDDGADLMFYRLRDRAGRADAHSAGVAVRDGRQTRLAARDVVLTPRRRWRGAGGAAYPLVWEMQVAPLGKTWELWAVVDDQEMALSVHYWEGMVEVREQGKVVGRGYLEMTGYE